MNNVVKGPETRTLQAYLKNCKKTNVISKVWFERMLSLAAPDHMRSGKLVKVNSEFDGKPTKGGQGGDMIKCPFFNGHPGCNIQNGW